MSDAYLAHRAAFLGMMDPGLYPADWLDAQVWSGAFRVFGNEQACILVSLKRYPSGVYEIHGEAAAGDLAGIKDLIGRAVEWGRSIGCRFASIASREGWARALKNDGWDIHQVTIRKEI